MSTCVCSCNISCLVEYKKAVAGAFSDCILLVPVISVCSTTTVIIITIKLKKLHYLPEYICRNPTLQCITFHTTFGTKRNINEDQPSQKKAIPNFGTLRDQMYLGGKNNNNAPELQLPLILLDQPLSEHL